MLVLKGFLTFDAEAETRRLFLPLHVSDVPSDIDIFSAPVHSRQVRHLRPGQTDYG